MGFIDFWGWIGIGMGILIFGIGIISGGVRDEPTTDAPPPRRKHE